MMFAIKKCTIKPKKESKWKEIKEKNLLVFMSALKVSDSLN